MSDDLRAFWQRELSRFLPDPEKALDEALEYIACPVCQVLTSMPFDYFAVLSKRWPEEAELRDVVTEAGGFCNSHSWRFGGMQSNAAIGRVLVDVLARLAKGAPEGDPICPVCHLESMASGVLLQLLARRLENETDRQRFGELFGLCYPHWRELLHLDLAPAVREDVIASQAAMAAILQRHVQGFLDKDTVELKWTRTKEENRAAHRALLKTAGNENI
jgi:hypothetical protein